MQQAFSATTEATPDDLLAVVGDLTSYPHWLDVVDEVVREAETTAPEAWVVTLRARVGPFSRSKRLRMVRTVFEDSAVRFERQELDGKDHSAWVLAAEVSPVDGDGPGNAPDHDQRSEVSLSLSYDGSMWSGLLDGVLEAAAGRATRKLQAYVKA